MGLDMIKLKKEQPDSQESLYIKKHNITQFLSDPDNLDKDTPIMFISDPTLQIEGDDFEDSAPLVAVVEVPSGGISVIVDNVEKHYQPIAIMPRSSENSPGAANLRQLRSQINKDAIGDLLRDENGNIIQTKLFPRIYAEAPERVQEHEDNVSLQTAGMESLTDTQAEQAKDLSKAERRSTTWYKKLRKKITDALEIINFDGQPVLSLNVNNLKGKNKDKSKETYPYIVLTTPVF